MLAILSNTIESAGRLSDNLQSYWNTQGVYASVSLFEAEGEFLKAMNEHAYERVIVVCKESPQKLIQHIRTCNPGCKIAVLIDNQEKERGEEIALICHRMGVEFLLTKDDLEKPLAMLSKSLSVV